MKISSIKKTVESFSLEELKTAESALMEGEDLQINVLGEDEGEQLTHIIAAIWVKEYMGKSNVDLKTAVREYTKKVRNSISLD